MTHTKYVIPRKMADYSQRSTKHGVQDIEMLRAGSKYTMDSYLPLCFSWLTE
jgi:hypothetical protein